MDYLGKSKKELAKRLTEDANLTAEEWSKYAKYFQLYSVTTLCAHGGFTSWEELKNVLIKENKIVDKKLKKLRRKLNKAIEEYGITAEQTLHVNEQMHQWINWYGKNWQLERKRETKMYPPNSDIYLLYQMSKQFLQDYVQKSKKFPSVHEWNVLAQKEGYMSSVGIEYITGNNWNEIRQDIKSRIK